MTLKSTRRFQKQFDIDFVDLYMEYYKQSIKRVLLNIKLKQLPSRANIKFIKLFFLVLFQVEIIQLLRYLHKSKCKHWWTNLAC